MSQTTIQTWSKAEMDLRVGGEGDVLFFGQAVPFKTNIKSNLFCLHKVM